MLRENTLVISNTRRPSVQAILLLLYIDEAPLGLFQKYGRLNNKIYDKVYHKFMINAAEINVGHLKCLENNQIK